MPTATSLVACNILPHTHIGNHISRRTRVVHCLFKVGMLILIAPQRVIHCCQPIVLRTITTSIHCGRICHSLLDGSHLCRIARHLRYCTVDTRRCRSKWRRTAPLIVQSIHSVFAIGLARCSTEVSILHNISVRATLRLNSIREPYMPSPEDITTLLVVCRNYNITL